MIHSPRARRLAWAIVALAIGLRLALALAHPFWFPDSADYDALARAIAHGQTYQVNGLFATRMPGYPLFVAAIYALCGPSAKAVLVAQALLGGAATWLVYLLGKRISSAVALLAALLAALDPLSIGFSAALLSESAFTLLMLLALWMIVRWMEDGRFGWWIAAGLTWGASVYMRASALWCIVPLALGAALMRKRGEPPRAGRWRGPLVAVLLVLVSLLPWQLRNDGLFHDRLFRLTTLEGISLYEAVYPGADGSPKQDIIPLPPEMRGLNEAQRDDAWGHRAWQFVRSDPLRILHLAVRKMGRTWSPWLNAVEFRNDRLQAALVLWHVPLFLFALIGLFARWGAPHIAPGLPGIARNHKKVTNEPETLHLKTPNTITQGSVQGRLPPGLKALLFLPMAYFTTVHALFLGSVRYRVPLMPLVCLFAAAGATAVVKWWIARKRPASSRVYSQGAPPAAGSAQAGGAYERPSE